MKGSSRHRRHFDGSRLITIISVAMVLLVMGITVILGIGTHQAGRLVRSNVGFVAVVNPSFGQKSLDSVRTALNNAPYVSEITTRTADEVLKRWEELMGPEELIDINPFLPEYDVTVRPEWAKPDSLRKIAAELDRICCVDHIQLQADIAAEINHSVSSVFLLLMMVGIALLIISVVLISNTVKLQIHSQRFIIHTQQYVGATARYIVAPYVRRAALNGLLAAIIAAAALTALVFYAGAIDPVVPHIISGWAVAVTVAFIVIVGVVLCALTAHIAAMKYIHRSYDEIFN